MQCADVRVVFEPRRGLDDATGVGGIRDADDVSEAPISANYLCRCVIRLVKRDEYAWDEFSQAPFLSAGKDGGVESGFDSTLLLRKIGIERNVEENVGGWFLVVDCASSSAFSVDAKVDLAAFS